MRILGIETSCDETSVAIVEGKGEKLKCKAQITNSQIKEHAKYGGVVPEVAARRHVELLVPMLEELFNRRWLTRNNIDAVAVTQGPGLVGALRIGVQAAVVLSTVWDKPLLAVNHLAGHVYANWISRSSRQPSIRFPVLCLIVSGGHTQIVMMRKHDSFETLGETRDDAAGEAFDKVAKMLGLGYPGGPEISRLAKKGNEKRFDFPRPMLDSDDFDFSFSGLKTAVLYSLREFSNFSISQFPNGLKADFCASFQEAVVGVLVGKMTRAIEVTNPKTVLLAGGVSANERLRKKLGIAIKKNFSRTICVIPPLKYTTDNAAMIAGAGYFKLLRGEICNPLTLEADPNLSL